MSLDHSGDIDVEWPIKELEWTIFKVIAKLCNIHISLMHIKKKRRTFIYLEGSKPKYSDVRHAWHQWT